MPKIEWSEELSVKVPSFDNEHKRLVDLFNKLYEAMVDEKEQKIIPSILMSLANYTKIHFNHEEEEMVKHNFPGYEAHLKEHSELVLKLNEMENQYKNGTITLSMPMFKFLLSWVQNHIQKSDMEYADFFSERGVK
jgi:hemerythrin